MRITDNVRRQILDNLIHIGECFGTNGRAVDFARRVAPYYKNTSKLEQHMDHFKDWTIDQLFYDELELLSVDDIQFEDFCREYMNPVFVRRKKHRDEYDEFYFEDVNPKCLKTINDGLEMVDLELISDADKEGFYKLRNKVVLPSDSIKNILFAANKKSQILLLIMCWKIQSK